MTKLVLATTSQADTYTLNLKIVSLLYFIHFIYVTKLFLINSLSLPNPLLSSWQKMLVS